MIRVRGTLRESECVEAAPPPPPLPPQNGARESTDRAARSFRARPVAEFMDHVAAGYRVKLDRIHVVVCHHVVAEAGVVGAQHVLGGGRYDVSGGVVTGMKEQRGVGADAYIADAEKQRAGRPALAIDPKQFARLVVLADDWIEADEAAAGLVTGCRPLRPRRGRGHQQHGNDKASHGQRYSSGSVVNSSG